VVAALAWAVPASGAGDDAYGQAVAAVKTLGGEVRFNRALGEGTIEVGFADAKPRGDVAVALKKFDRPVALEFVKTNITDAELTALLQGLPELKGLTLVMEPKITDAGLAALKGLKGLQSLYLAGTRATDAGLANLEGLTGLRNLGVVAGAEITDGGIGHIEVLTNLQSLDLRATRVGDAGVARLERLAGLRGLDLDGTRVTDAGVVHLIGLKNLRRLSVKTTKVTDDRVASLLVARPQLRVVR
jgi:hypothetical protein